MKRIIWTLVIAGLFGASELRAQAPPSSEVAPIPLEDLLQTEVVSVASRFPQDVREAPASITIVTSQQIRRAGHRTLADVLRSVRGLYTTYDRNYSYIGIRGFARPGDYNTRVLLLVNGQRLNDPVYDMAPIGTDFPIDVWLIDRVEVIRGPASSLYGTNAFFAVINIVTRSGAQHAGLRVQSAAGSLGTYGGAVTFGRALRNGGDVLLAGSAQQSSGAGRIHYPEFDTGEAGSGVAVGLDGDESSNVFGSLAIGRMKLHGGAAARTKHVPTASFGTAFGDRRHTTTDGRAYLSAAFDGAIGRGWSAATRASYDYYYYEGFSPTDYGLADPVLLRDANDSRMLSAETTLRRRVARRHQLTAGAEVRRHYRNDMTIADEEGLVLDVRRPATFAGAYVQDEVRLAPWLLASGGVRLDRAPSFGAHVSPRAGLVLLPRGRTSVKLLHGRAFRAPNTYELYYYSPMREGGFELEPESIQSTEIVWEEYVSSRMRTSLTAFTYNGDGIIEQQSLDLPGGDDIYFVNAGRFQGRGLEGELELILPSGIRGHVSHTYAAVRDTVNDRPFSNSPRHLSKLTIEIPVSRFHLAADGHVIGRRLTLAGGSLAPVFLQNIALTSPEDRRLRLVLGIYNLFDRRYQDPAGEEHLQQALPQDGRTALARVGVRF